MAYSHRVSTYHNSNRARKIKKITVLVLFLLILGIGIVGVDWLVSSLKENETVVSVGSSAAVQSAKINIFQTPYFRFQAGDDWKEVTDELSTSDKNNTIQYLYRKFDKSFIEHELWITVDLPKDYRILSHNIPTRIIPVRVEKDGRLTQLNSVSEHCFNVLPKENPNLSPHIVKQNNIEYYCNPNEANDYYVTVGIPGGTNRLPMPHGESGNVDITITYRDITLNPDSRELESILSTFRSH